MKAARKPLSQGSRFVILMALGPSGGRVIKTINQWLSDSGTEWTVNRLKALRTAALQLRAGNHDVAREIYRKQSIAYYHGSLIPRGPYGHVFTLFLKAQRPSVLRRIESVLRVYTSLYLSEVSSQQYSKAKTAINTPYQGVGELPDKLRYLVGVWAEGDVMTRVHSPERLWENGKPRLRKPSLTRLKAYTMTHVSEKVRVPPELRTTPYGTACLSFATTTVWPRIFRTTLTPDESVWYPDTYFNGYMPREVWDHIQSIVWSPSSDLDYAGHISLIQEGGAKGRVVAVPTAPLQWAFWPLHDWLDSVLRQLPASCIHDQNQGAYWLRQKLYHGETLWSFDLSSATDRFPLSFQTTLLRKLGLSEYADALEEIVSEDWRVSWGPNGTEAWKYNCGQPMGLYGSFPLFSITHYALLEVICAIAGVDPVDPPFRLLGDDVVISNKRIANGYNNALKSLGVEVSPTKTVKSSKVAEFAGFVGYRTNKSVAVFRPYKHGPGKYIHNPVNLLHSLGRGLGRAGSPYWDRKVYEFQCTKAWRNPDLSPLICQDEVGGVNPQLLDTNRLANLLWASSAHAKDQGNTWTGERFTPNRIEDLAEVLLGKQESGDDSHRDFYGRNPMELLATPEPNLSPKGDRPTNWSKDLASDPLMKVASKGPLHQPPPDTEPVFEFEYVGCEGDTSADQVDQQENGREELTRLDFGQ